ncbi:oxidative damage protection protein [Sedimenticola selenatireducens]|uniref:Probable Fe(2+)-trafficking protein n=1 Tax=Sedimenticola selenatireducens TaxID=191960 RepID=A0A558DU24_9GAMM|nr:oxidative damage protection protein [Sedimenticola selenatireducens]TVO77083.1 oxidative damage protection protein [Sedimenticola selenatireducens]TVT64526.1 MAG: oxidative damage protection protein [Sedimenticola selenatireducens]
MSRMVECVKLNKMAEGLERPPYPGALGQRVFDNISKEAWQLWLQQQTILINENRLSLAEPKSRVFLEEQMVKFLFEGGGTQVNFTP